MEDHSLPQEVLDDGGVVPEQRRALGLLFRGPDNADEDLRGLEIPGQPDIVHGNDPALGNRDLPGQ